MTVPEIMPLINKVLTDLENLKNDDYVGWLDMHFLIKLEIQPL